MLICRRWVISDSRLPVLFLRLSLSRRNLKPHPQVSGLFSLSAVGGKPSTVGYWYCSWDSQIPEEFGFSFAGIEVKQLVCRWWITFDSGLLVLLLKLAISRGILGSHLQVHRFTGGTAYLPLICYLQQWATGSAFSFAGFEIAWKTAYLPLIELSSTVG